MDTQPVSSPIGERCYCHECAAEWSRQQHGLTCPECHSDFTEVIEEDNDPRSPPQSASTFTYPDTARSRTTNTADDDEDNWEDAPDPDEDDIANLAGSNADPRGRSRPSDRPPLSAVSNSPLGMSGILQEFTTMLSSIIGSPMADRHHQTPQSPTRSQSLPRTPTATSDSPRPSSPHDWRAQSRLYSPDDSEQAHAHAHGQPHSHTTIRQGGGGNFHWTITTTRGPPIPMGFMPPHVHGHYHGDDATDPNTPQGGTPISPLGSILALLLRNAGDGRFAGPGDPRAAFGPLGPLAMLFGNPADMQHGDAVYSQEALDRIISNLMEQNVHGTAPGPASHEAISALPQRTITDDDLGSDGKVECSVCIEEVHVGDKVTELPCHHWFHGACVTHWLEEHDTCPACRQSIMPKASGPNDTTAERLRSPQEAPRHDHTLGTPLPPSPAGGTGTYQNPWSVPDDSPVLSRRQSQSAGPPSSREGPVGGHAAPSSAMSGGGDSLFRRMRSAFGGVVGAGGSGGDGVPAASAQQTGDQTQQQQQAPKEASEPGDGPR